MFPVGEVGREEASLAFDLTQIVVGGREAPSTGGPGQQVIGGEVTQDGRRVKSTWLEEPWPSSGSHRVQDGHDPTQSDQRHSPKETRRSLVGGQRPLLPRLQ